MTVLFDIRHRDMGPRHLQNLHSYLDNLEEQALAD